MKEWIAEVFGVLGTNAWISHLWDTCVMTSVVILFLLLIRPLLKRLPRSVAYVLWIVVAAQILCPVSIQGIYGALPRQVAEQVYEGKQVLKMEEISNSLREAKLAAGSREKQTTEKEEPVKDEEPVQEAGQTVTAKETRHTKPVFTAVQGVLGVWALGVIVCVLLLIVSLARNKRRFADAILWKDNIYMHEAVENSFVGGVIVPKIYLSSKLRGEEYGRERELILCHERVHVKRRDYLIKIVCFLAFSVLWFNPLCWAAYHFFVLDMEVSCDEAVIRRLGVQARKEYSYLLLTMADKGRHGWFQEPAFSISSVKERIVRVMQYQKPRRYISVVSVVIVLLCSCGIASQPETVKNLVSKGEEDAEVTEFKEEVVDQTQEFTEFSQSGRLNVYEYCENVDDEGTYYKLAALMDQQKFEKFIKLKRVDGVWKEEDVPWNQVLLDYMKKLDKYWYPYISILEGEDGQIYVALEKWSAPYDVQDSKGGNYVVEDRLLRYDAENNQLVKVKIPQISAKKAYGREEQKGIASNRYLAAGDNKVLVVTAEKLFGWYDLTTGECINPMEDVCKECTMTTTIAKGDGVIALTSQQNGKTLDVNVYDMDSGKLEYTIPTEVDINDWKKMQENLLNFYQLDIRNDTIYFLTPDGVDKVEIGEEKWSKFMDPETSHEFYFSESDMATDGFIVISDSEFYIDMYKLKTGSEVTPQCCRYTKIAG